MAPFALHMMTRAESRAARGWLGVGMAIGLVCGGLMMASLVLWIEHLLGGIIHGADLAMWLLAAATLTALFLLVFLALIPHFARVTEQRTRRMVRPPSPREVNPRDHAAA